MLRRTFLLTLLCLALAGCGYRLLERPAAGTSAGPGSEQVEIRMFENRSDQAGVEGLFAVALAEEFARRGNFEPVVRAGGEQALILRGRILEVRVNPVAYSSVGLALEARIVVVLDVEMVRGPGFESVWRNGSIELNARFLASSDNEVYENQKQEALRRIAWGAAGRIHDEFLQSF